MVRSLLSLPDRLDLHGTAIYSGPRPGHTRNGGQPAPWVDPSRVREFNRLGRLLDEVSAVNGGEALANGEEVRIAGFGTFGPGAGRPVPGAPPGPERRFRYRRRCHRLSGQEWHSGMRLMPATGRDRGLAANSRPGTPRILPIWKPADYDTMTDPPGLTALLRESQCGRRVAGLAAAGLDTRLRMRQEGRGGAWN